MNETIDQTLRRWLRKWLGIEGDYRELTGRCMTQQQRNSPPRAEFDGLIYSVDALGKALQAALTDLENTRQDLIQRMDDLAKDIAESKAVKQTNESSESETVRPGHVPFSVRRKQAQGSGRNMQAYLQPKK